MISILVPTKNRPKQVIQLLNSIAEVGTKDNLEIIVVATGEDLKKIIDSYQNRLNIKYLYSNQGGQAHQKMLGLEVLNKECKWVIFCDDDLQFSAGFFNNFMEVSQDFPNAIGFGLNLSVQNKVSKRNALFRAIAKLAGLNSNRMGKVLKNGHAVNYMNSKSPLKTEWLSGASIWKRDIAVLYKSDYPFSKYAAYEDVIFSYSKRSYGEMIFDPRLKLDFQEKQSYDVTNLEVFLSATSWRFYFVSINKELSLLYMIWTQLFRNMFYLHENRYKNFTKINKILLDIVILRTCKNHPLGIVKKYCQEVS